MTAPPAVVSALTVYPVKGMRGIELDCARLTPTGLDRDRAFMVVRRDGRFVTQRDCPRLALIVTALDGDGVTLSREGLGAIRVPFDREDGDRVRTRVWKDPCETVDQGAAVSRWLSAALESAEPLRLVAMAPGFRRPQGKADLLGAGAHTLFADAAPFLVAGAESLAALNRELAARGFDAVPMNRFRPNIVVRGLPAFAEHRAGRWRAEGWALRLCHPCERCIVTTIDQATALRHPEREPYRTLADINPVPGSDTAPAFGQNAVLVESTRGEISVGDRFQIEETTE
jgi:uncharacterized protein YcbX